MTIHINMLKFIQYWETIHNLILLNYLLLNFTLVLSVVGRVDYILQLTIVANLQSTDLLTVQSDVDTLDLDRSCPRRARPSGRYTKWGFQRNIGLRQEAVRHREGLCAW